MERKGCVSLENSKYFTILDDYMTILTDYTTISRMTIVRLTKLQPDFHKLNSAT